METLEFANTLVKDGALKMYKAEDLRFRDDFNLAVELLRNYL